MKRTLDPELMRAVSETIEAQLGLHYPPDRWLDLERGLRGAAKELGFESVEECARKLVRARLGRAQINSLAGHLTIGETYFFRDTPVFDIIPAVVHEARNRGKHLRIWSAGCCTGEEPYSIAIALHRAIHDLDDWQITVLGTDLNPRFLNAAVVGVYGQWSFRGVPEELKHAYFRQSPEGRFEVLPDIRKMVTFECLNLVEDVYPTLANNTNAMDVIFCRNVLMYFSRPQLRKVVANFRRSLVEGGRLILSASEASWELLTGFVPGGIAGVPLYRKHTPPEAVPPSAPIPVRFPARVMPPVNVARPLALPSPPRDHAADARRLANEGEFAEALAACDRALAEDRLVPALHYLRGVILQEQNATEEAVTAMQRALFLDANFVLAHFTLGHLRLRQGRKSDATRCFANARALLSSCAPEAVLAESGGVTAQRLLAIIASTEEVFA
jgi:chemotaxis protein methyltransferase CheR